MRKLEENTASNEFALTEPDRKQNEYTMQRLLLDEEECLKPAPELGIVSAKAIFMRCRVNGEAGGFRSFRSDEGHITTIIQRELNPAEMTINQMTLDRAAFWIDVQLPGMAEPAPCWVELIDGILSCSPAGWLELVRLFFVSRGILVK